MDYAKEILVHYFETVWRQAGLNWTSDNQAEIEGAVDDLVRGIKAETVRECERVYPLD